MRSKYWLGSLALISIGTIGVAVAQAPDDGAFAEALWTELEAQHLVGQNALGAVPYLRSGQAHAATLVSLLGTATINGVTGQVIVKRSYADGATREAIIGNPAENITAITVMFQREDGYDPNAGDWFWAMYTPDGAIAQMEGMAVAGRAEGCSGCHATAPGEDFVFLY
jgi:hypothetical protein